MAYTRYNTSEVMNMYGMFQSPYSGMGMNNPAANVYQQRLQQMQAPYQQQQYGMPQQGIKGRIVTGMEEARAAQIDLDGSVSVFPSPSEHRIYTKTIDINGNPVFEVYQKTTMQEAKTPAYADSGVVAALQQRVEQLEMMIQGVVKNDESHAIFTSNAGKPKSHANDASSIR